MHSATALGILKKVPPVRVTAQTSNPGAVRLSIGAQSGSVLQGIFIGDDTALAMGTGLVAHPVWTDFRGNPTLSGSSPNQDVFTAAVRVR
jgi:hypothetical protein